MQDDPDLPPNLSDRLDGDPYNILVVGDGYDDSDEDAELFTDHCNSLLEPIMNPDPATFPSWATGIQDYVEEREGSLIRDLTFYKWREVSEESGVTNIRKTTTAFGVHYTSHPWVVDTTKDNDHSMLSGIELYARTNALRRSVLAATGTRIHRVLILANSTRRAAGHTGGALLVPGGYKDKDGSGRGPFGLFQHELGHALGLGDEYYAENGPQTAPNDTNKPAGDPLQTKDYPYPNVSRDMFGKTALNGEAKAPGWPTELAQGEDIAHRTGAIYNPAAFRPAPDCIMRDAESETFCPVCKQHFIDFFTLRAGRRQYPWMVTQHSAIGARVAPG